MSEDLIAKFYDHVREVKDLGFKDGYGGDVGIRVTRSRFTVIPVPSRDYWDSSWGKILSDYVAGDKGFAVEIVNLRYGEPGGKQPANGRHLFKTEEEAEAHVTAYVQARLKYAASRIQEEEVMSEDRTQLPEKYTARKTWNGYGFSKHSESAKEYATYAEAVAACWADVDAQRAIGAAEGKVPLTLVNGDHVRLQVQSITGIDGKDGCEFRLLVNGVPSELGIIASTFANATTRNAEMVVAPTDLKDADDPDWVAFYPQFTPEELEAAAHICERTVGMSRTVLLGMRFAEKVRATQNAEEGS